VRAADLVTADRHEVHAAGGEVHRHLTHGLDRVGVDRDTELVGDPCDLGDLLDGAHLVVGPHDADERDGLGVGLDRRAHRLRTHAAELVDIEPGDLGALVRHEEVDAVEDSVVLDRRHEQPHAGGVGVSARPVGALDGEVVGLGASRGEEHLGRARPEAARDLLPRLLHRPA